MNIIFESNITPELRERCTLLRLDRIFIKDLDRICTAYCIIQNIPMSEMATLENYLELHENMMDNFYKRNWDFCEQALEHLLGRWNKEVDSFYESFSIRLSELKNATLDDSWDGTISGSA